MRISRALPFIAIVFLGLSLVACGPFSVEWPTPALVTGYHVSRLSFYNDSLYFGAGYCLYRLDIQSQTLHNLLCTTGWTFQRPAIDGKRAYAYVLTSPEAAQFLVAIDLSTGQVVWRVGESPGCGPYLRDAKDNVFLSDGQVIAVRADRCSRKQHICAFDKDTGQYLWCIPDSLTARGKPFAIYGGLIWYVIDGEPKDTDAGVVVAVDPKTGREMQRVNLAERGRAEQVLYVTDQLILVQGSLGSESQRRIFAINRGEASEVVWVADVVPRGWLLQLTSQGDLLVLQDQDGAVYGLDIRSGEMRWTFWPGTAPLVQQPQMVIPCVRLGGLFVYGIDIVAGTEVWKYSLEPADTSPVEPLVSGNIVYIATKNSIDALNLVTGKVLWSVPLDSSYEYYADSAVH